jgi:uncharacterized protein YdaU (DUF1376 family)
MTDEEFAELVAHATELRKQLEGRLPDRLQWGWKDFLLGTAGMSATEVGAYVLMLHQQWDKGAVPLDMASVALIARLAPAELEAAWQKLGPKFRAHAGSQYNLRALQEFIAAAEATLGQRQRKRKSRAGAPVVQPGARQATDDLPTDDEGKSLF